MTRQGYAGLDSGLHYSATLAFPNRITHPTQRARMRSILQDGVWTPFRACRVGAGLGRCIHCGGPQADATHIWWECASLNRAHFDAHVDGWVFSQLQDAWRSAAGHPPCLWRAGTVPRLLMPSSPSPLLAMEDSPSPPSQTCSAGPITVVTDGSALRRLGALCGVWCSLPHPPHRLTLLDLCTAPRKPRNVLSCGLCARRWSSPLLSFVWCLTVPMLYKASPTCSLVDSICPH